MTVVIAIANEKGGVGKSTTAANLSAGIALKLAHGEKTPGRVLLLDLDPQLNALMAVAYGNHSADPKETISALLVSDTPPSPQRLIRRAELHENLDFIPGNEPAQKEAAHRISMLPGPDLRLTNAIRPILGEYKYIIIDTPPNAGPMLHNAIMASTYIIIPIEMSYQGASGLGALHKTISRVLVAYQRSEPPKIGYLPTMLESRASDAHDALDGLKKRYKDLVFKPIHRNRVIQKANAAHMDVFRFKPPRSFDDGIESSEKASKEYASFVEEVIRRTNSSK